MIRNPENGHVILAGTVKDEQSILDFQDTAWKRWGRVCLRCRRPAITLHEIVSRSVYQNWWKDILNSIPVCNECHLWAHRNGEAGRAELQDIVRKWVELHK